MSSPNNPNIEKEEEKENNGFWQGVAAVGAMVGLAASLWYVASKRDTIMKFLDEAWDALSGVEEEYEGAVFQSAPMPETLKDKDEQLKDARAQLKVVRKKEKLSDDELETLEQEILRLYDQATKWQIARAVTRSRPTIDLHYYTVEAAQECVQETLKALRETHQQATTLLIITGAGHHSQNKIPIIKPRVEQFLKDQGYDFTEADHGGSFKVSLQ